jgi:hypothetical protein
VDTTAEWNVHPFLLGVIAVFYLFLLGTSLRRRYLRRNMIVARQEQLDKVQSGDHDAIAAFVEQWHQGPARFYSGLRDAGLKVRFNELWPVAKRQYDYKTYRKTVQVARDAWLNAEGSDQEQSALLGFFKELAGYFGDGFWEQYIQEAKINLVARVGRLNQLLARESTDTLGPIGELNEAKLRAFARFQELRLNLLPAAAAELWGIKLQYWPVNWNALVDNLAVRPEYDFYRLPEASNQDKYWYNFDAILYQLLERVTNHGDTHHDVAREIKRMKSRAEMHDVWFDVDSLLRDRAEMLIARSFPINTLTPR